MREKCVHGIEQGNKCVDCDEFRSKHNDINDTLDEREKSYGDYRDQCAITRRIKNVMCRSSNWGILTDDKKEALDMIAVKIGRILNGDSNHKDSWHDISGYAKLVEDTLGSP